MRLVALDVSADVWSLKKDLLEEMMGLKVLELAWSAVFVNKRFELHEWIWCATHYWRTKSNSPFQHFISQLSHSLWFVSEMVDSTELAATSIIVVSGLTGLLFAWYQRTQVSKVV